MRGLDMLGASLLTHVAPPTLTPPPVTRRAPPTLAPPPVTRQAPPVFSPPPGKPPAPAQPIKPSARAVASAHKAQAAASRAIAAGQKLSKHNKRAGQILIATGNAHNARAQALLKPTLTPAQQRGVMGDYVGDQGPDPGTVDPQTDAVNAVAQLGEMASQMLDWVTTLQQNGAPAAWAQVATAQRGAM